MFQVGAIFGSAYIRAATPEVAINGFRATGIFLSTDVFADCDFAPSSVTDQPHQSPVAPLSSPSTGSDDEAMATETADLSTGSGK